MEIRQSIFLKGNRSVRIMPDDTLSVAVRSGGAVTEYSVPLRALHESPVRTRQPPAQFMLGFVVSSFLLTGALVAQLFASTGEMHALFGFLAFLALLPFGVSIYRFWRYTFDITSFQFRSSGQTAFNLFTDKPDAQTFQQFRDLLIKQIKNAQLHDVDRQSDSVSAQLQSFAKLREQGILTEEEFQNIKTRLLGTLMPPSGPIGFKV